MKNKEQIAKIWDVLDSLNIDVLQNKQAIIKLENEREKPQLKQLDQSVFKNMHKRWKFAAVDKNGKAHWFSKEVIPYMGGFCYEGSDYKEFKFSLIGKGYDASNWQTSLIERETNELTGSELCRAMLARGDKYVMCKTSGTGEAEAMESKYLDVIQKCDWEFFYTPYKKRYAVPVNNQGEPLTSSDVGL